MKTKTKYIVMADNGQESEPMETREQCEKWVSESLPVGIQKCRTGCYYIEEIEVES